VCLKSCLHRTSCFVIVVALLAAARAPAQGQLSSDAVQKILDRLDALEKQNEALLAEVKELRETVKSAQTASAAPTERLEEQVEVHGQQIKDLAQTKISSSQRFSMSLTGMFLFDSYLFTGPTSSGYFPTYSTSPFGESSAGATLRQSIIGLDFSGPRLPGDGRVHGSLSMDFFAQVENAQTGYDDIFRIRRGIVSFDWKNRSVIVGQDKSLIAPLQPTSFAQVGIPPLSGAGNLWLWRPQVRYQERIPLSSATQATFEAGVLETNERYSAAYLPGNAYIEPARPAIQGRFELQHNWSEETRIEVGFGAHASESHVNGQSVPSRVFSIDALYKPLQKLELSGTIFYGKNFANLGGEPPGVTVRRDGAVIPIRGGAGWVQVALPVTSRLTFDVWAGRQANNSHDLNSYEIYRTLSYAGNVLYRLSPNVIIGFEGGKDELENYHLHQLLTNRYDATIAYLF
jgi:hypothetical protein